jgi:hypothetical protein
MTSPFPANEFFGLMYDLVEDRLTPDKAARLEELLLADPANRQRYVDFMLIVSGLHRTREEEDSGFKVHGSNAADRQSEIHDSQTAIPPIIVDCSPTVHGSLSASLFTPGGFLFSYLAAGLLVGVGLLIGWTWRISHYEYHYQRIADVAPRQVPSPGEPATQSRFVGRITGVVDCRWANPATAAVDGEHVPLGRGYSLASGFMEITYDSGAKVILQGPAAYEIESASGGFLSLGKLTARVESRESRVESEDGRQDRSRLSTLDSRLFSVRTPTAVVTDLGTEFGVEVDGSGASRTHVFQGKIELRPADGDKSVHPIQLKANESARVERGTNRTITMKLTSARDASPPDAFAREMPKRVPIRVFSTGLGLNAGDLDPHWQLVARSDDPAFHPRPAVVALVTWQHRPNDPRRSQWISIAGDMPALPNNATYTFRTTFELEGAWAESIVLRGAFAADNHVEVIRLNGVSQPVPAHGRQAPFDQLHAFVIEKGFRKGANVLEVVVDNSAPGVRSSPESPMALRMELYGAVIPGGEVSPRNSAETKKPKM